MKTCNKCQALKTDEEFYFRNSEKTARRATCILCLKEYHKDNIARINIQKTLTNSTVSPAFILIINASDFIHNFTI